MSLNITTKLHYQDLNVDCNDIPEVNQLKSLITTSNPEIVCELLIKEVKNFPNIKLNSYYNYKFIDNKEAIQERVISGVNFYTIVRENEIIRLETYENHILCIKKTKDLVERKKVTNNKITYSNGICSCNKQNVIKIKIGKDINEYEYEYLTYKTKEPINSSKLFDPLNLNDYKSFVQDIHKQLKVDYNCTW